jgi:hypothetical protein
MHLSKGDYGVLESGATMTLIAVDWMSTDKRACCHLMDPLPDCSIKGEVKKKHISFGWNFSCFSAHLIERDLF